LIKTVEGFAMTRILLATASGAIREGRRTYAFSALCQRGPAGPPDFVIPAKAGIQTKSRVCGDTSLYPRYRA
jgi:hypothetical protein